MGTGVYDSNLQPTEKPIRKTKRRIVDPQNRCTANGEEGKSAVDLHCGLDAVKNVQ